MRQALKDLLVAFQFLTRLPLPQLDYDPASLSRSLKFFPLVGLVIGLLGAWFERLLAPHLSRPLAAFLVLLLFVLVTGALHEDGLADTVDGFGGGRNREQILAIMHDSRIGSFGASALALSLIARLLLLSALPANRFTAFVVSAQVLSRWTALPLSYILQPARAENGQGARIAQKISGVSMVAGTLLTLLIVFYVMHARFWIPIVLVLMVTVLSGLYYFRRLGGITGDCFGAANQLAEIAVYFCGVWIA